MLEHFYMSKDICKLCPYNLLLETGRYVKPKSIPRSERICKYCTLNLIEMRFTFVHSVLYMNQTEKKLYDHIQSINMTLCINAKALWLLSQKDKNILSALGTYIDCCFEKKN